MATLFWTFTLSPITTPPATMVFWPKLQRRPMRAPPNTCAKCQMLVPWPIRAPSSTTAVGWTKALMRISNEGSWSIGLRTWEAGSSCRLLSHFAQHDRPSIQTQGDLARLQDAQDLQTLRGVARRLLAGPNALQKGLAFVAQGLRGGQGDHPGTALLQNGLRVVEIHPLIVQDQLFSVQEVVEHGHLRAPDHDEPLFLEGVQPADEDVGPDARSEMETGNRDVGKVGRDVAPAATRDLDGKLPRQPKDHGDVGRCETPEGVFLDPDPSEVEAIRVDVVDLTESPLRDQTSQLEDGRMVVEEVTDHQQPTPLLGFGPHARALLVRQGQRL